jgi:hypothetical protein
MRPDACPSCGGLDRREIAPGDFECLTQRVVGMVPPQANGLSVHTPVHRICGCRYQVPVSSVTCHCGKYSIGKCSRCDQPVCGRHATESRSLFLCLDCQAEDDDASRAAARQAAVDTISAWEVEARKAVLNVPDPIERALRVRHELGDNFFDPTLRSLAETPVSKAEMAAWFLRVATSPPPQRSTRRVGLFGWIRWARVVPDVWNIGDTDRALPDSFSDQNSTSFAMAVMSADGHVFTLGTDGGLHPLRPGESVKENGWFRAAKRPPLNIPAKPSWVVYKTTERS